MSCCFTAVVVSTCAPCVVWFGMVVVVLGERVGKHSTLKRRADRSICRRTCCFSVPCHPHLCPLVFDDADPDHLLYVPYLPLPLPLPDGRTDGWMDALYDTLFLGCAVNASVYICRPPRHGRPAREFASAPRSAAAAAAAACGSGERRGVAPLWKRSLAIARPSQHAMGKFLVFAFVVVVGLV